MNTDKHYAKKRRADKRRLSPWALAAIDIVCAGLILCVYALFHHVLPMRSSGATVLPTPAVIATPTPTASHAAAASAQNSLEPTPTPTVDPTMFGAKFPGMFTDGEVIRTDTEYRSENIYVRYKNFTYMDSTVHLADIYLTDIKYLRSAYAGGEFKTNTTAFVDAMAIENNAVVAISGDHYGMRREGVVVRNGVLSRESRLDDVCILYHDGVMETLTNEEFDLDLIKTAGAYQVWSFGPMLMENGAPKTEFPSSNLPGVNPRAGIGMVEPGHYVFIQVDGNRSPSSDRGVTLAELAQLFADSGCTVAYNLDGGATAAFAWNNELVSAKYRRAASDCIYIGEIEE